jgi:beta-mannanase
VRNVTWFMYASSRYMDPTFQDSSEWLHPKFFYPGDAYMDWVGQSVYFADPAATKPVNEDASLVEPAILPGYNAWGEVTQRPLFLPEFGALGDASASRAAVIRDVMQNYLPTLPRVKALTLADFWIAEVCCQVPRLGQTFPEEVEAWRESVTRNPLYLESAPRVGSAGQ